MISFVHSLTHIVMLPIPLREKKKHIDTAFQRRRSKEKYCSRHFKTRKHSHHHFFLSLISNLSRLFVGSATPSFYIKGPGDHYLFTLGLEFSLSSTWYSLATLQRFSFSCFKSDAFLASTSPVAVIVPGCCSFSISAIMSSFCCKSSFTL